MLWAITGRPFGAGEVGWGEEVGAEGIEVEGGGAGRLAGGWKGPMKRG